MPAAPPDPVFVVGVIVLLGFCIGLAKGGFNVLSAVLTPLLSLVLPVALAVGVLLPMLIVGDALAVSAYWREWDGRLVRRMLPAGVLGALAGTGLLTYLSPTALRLTLAGFVLLIVVYKLASDRIAHWRYQPRGWHAPAAALIAGVASGMFNNGGPAFNSFLLLQRLPPRTYIATTAVFFALLNLLKVPGFLWTGVLDMPRLLTLWWAFPCIPVGLWAARWLIRRVDQRVFEWIILGLLVLSSGLLIWQSR